MRITVQSYLFLTIVDLQGEVPLINIPELIFETTGITCSQAHVYILHKELQAAGLINSRILRRGMRGRDPIVISITDIGRAMAKTYANSTITSLFNLALQAKHFE